MPEDIIAESDVETQEPVTESNTKPAVDKMAKKNEVDHIEESDEEMPEPIDFGEEEEEADDDTQGKALIDDAKQDEKLEDDDEKDEDKKDEIELNKDVDDAFTPASKLRDAGKSKSRAKKDDTKVAAGIKKKTDAKEKKTKKLLVRKKESPKKPAKQLAKGKTSSSTKSTQSSQSKKVKSSSATEAKSKTAKAKKTITKGSKTNGKKQLLAIKKDSSASPAKKVVQKKKTSKTTQAKSNSPTKKEKVKTVATKQKKKKTTKKKVVEEEEEEEHTVAGDDSESELEVDDEEPLQMTPVKHGIIGNLACSSRDTNTQALLDHSVHQLGKYRVVEYDAQSEHVLDAYVVSKECARGWGVLQALASGVPLIYSEWVANSISQGKWLDMKLYRSDRFGTSPRSIDGGDSLSNLLQGLRIKVKCVGKDAMSVRKLVRLCGGRVAETRMDVVINDTKKEVEGAVNVEKKWLADCIEAGVIIEYEPYILS